MESDIPAAVDAPPASNPPRTRFVVRFSQMRQLGEFTGKASDDFRRGDEVIVKTERGAEWGEVLCDATERTREYLGVAEERGRILRHVTSQDRQDRDRRLATEREHYEAGRNIIRERGLPMQLVDVEHLFDGDRTVFYYVSENRVDFRELVKLIARQIQVRVEMRQIGIRDEAKLLADYGDCGKPVCCNTHLREMPPVSMKMAKLQKASLDPNKISGRCGRLKCCLRYEYDTYEEHRRELPPVGAIVVTKQGQGKVVAQELLAKKLIVAYEDRRQVLTDARDIVTVVSARGGKTEQSA